MLATVAVVVTRPHDGNRKETHPHVNDPPLNVVTCVGVLGHVGEVACVQSVLIDRVPYTLVLNVILHVGVEEVDDGRDEVSRVVLLLPVVDDLVLLLTFSERY